MRVDEGNLFHTLVEIMTRLRGEGGCPWDREQTRESLKPFLIEETYEVLEALDRGDLAALREELGDLLLQVVFHAEVAREKGEFTCPYGPQGCFACKPFEKIVKGEAELVAVEESRKTEMYIV